MISYASRPTLNLAAISFARTLRIYRKPMNRFSAFATHLGISFIIFLGLAYLIVYQWYPGMFFDTDGGWRGMRIIFAVDLVLGPLLTLTVFKAGKPGLKFDLTAIATLQFVCLLAGTFIVYSERPIAVVYNDGRFTVTTSDDYADNSDTGVPDLKHFPGSNPKWVMVNTPSDLVENAELMIETYRSGGLLSSRADLYIPFSNEDQNFLSASTNTKLLREQKRWSMSLDSWLEVRGGTDDDYRFYTFTTRYSFGFLIYDRVTNKKIGLITSEPLSKASQIISLD